MSAKYLVYKCAMGHMNTFVPTFDAIYPPCVPSERKRTWLSTTSRLFNIYATFVRSLSPIHTNYFDNILADSVCPHLTSHERQIRQAVFPYYVF